MGTEAEQPVDTALNATRRHLPNGLGEYKTYRSNIDVVDSYGNRNNAAFLSRDADAWLMAREAFDLFGNVKPPSTLRIPDPESFDFHDRTTGHDRQWNYTVHTGTTMDLTEALVNVSEAGNARRIAKLMPKNDVPVNHKRIVPGPTLTGQPLRGDHARDAIMGDLPYTRVMRHKIARVVNHAEMPDRWHHVKLVTGFRGKVSIGHGKWITPAGKDGRPSTEAARIEAAAAQLADIMEVSRDEAGQAAYGRLTNGARNLRLRTPDGVVITVRRSGHSAISIDVKRAQKRVKGQKAPTARTSCSHESYVSSAIDRCLAKLD